ncbi:MAG: SGNH/GDSL hydrolase family protein [Elusimicrobia bacterium]|nr:SGNH/GDSL hydrolase family protein [Elusimicrobiota bacterium]
MKAASRAAAAAAVALLAIGACELGLRGRLGGDPGRRERLFLDETRYLHEESRAPFFRGTVKGGSEFWTTARPRANPQEFPAAKEKGELRVVVAGESVAQRLGSGDLERAFSNFFPERRARVVNCGMGTYDAYRTMLSVSESKPYAPDLFVVLAGNNDGARPETLSYPAYRVNLFLRSFWLWRLPQDWLAARFRRADPRAVESRFEERLRETVRAAKRMSVPIVLCTLPVNLRDYPPLTERAMRHFIREEFAQAVELDYRDRCPPSRNELIRRVAAEEGAALADLEKVFARLERGTCPGWDMFEDGVHFRTRMYPIVTRTIAAAARIGPRSASDFHAVELAIKPWPPLDFSWKPGPELDAVLLAGIADALQAGLQEPPILLERAVAKFMLVERVAPGMLSRRLSDRDAIARDLAANPSTRSLSAEVSHGWGSIERHSAAALKRLNAPRVPKRRPERR